jgi:hypothetical protein
MHKSTARFHTDSQQGTRLRFGEFILNVRRVQREMLGTPAIANSNYQCAETKHTAKRKLKAHLAVMLHDSK